MPNALATSASPYLKQHADNPVAWQPWGETAFAEARRRDVPVLVSIGYSTCHWCHVMAHESFEDADTAALMNAHFVCIKVDREEHPEVDAIYMDAVQALTGHGGWPLNAFTDADGRPFHALTYLPRPAWRKLLDHLAALWRDDRARIAAAAQQITAHLQDEAVAPGALPADLWSGLERNLARAWDGAAPGWSYGEAKAPKFPSSQVLPLLLDSGRAPALRQAELVLEAMQDAGIHERVGGGFHRYSVDRHWRLPHFEKMLYDNAQLIAAYARAALVLGRPDFMRTAVNAGDYLLRDLRVVEGGAFLGYASAEDADDPDGEGSFYAWPPAELAAALGAEAGAALAAAWDITPGARPASAHGHVEPIVSHIPHPRGTALARLAPDGDVQALRAAWEPHLPLLRARRAARPRPGRDDKVLTDQNGLALEAFAALGRFSGEARFTAACAELAALLMARHHADGLIRLPGAAGQPARPAYITDYGALVTGLCAAFDLLGDPRAGRRGRARRRRGLGAPARRRWRLLHHARGSHRPGPPRPRADRQRLAVRAEQPGAGLRAPRRADRPGPLARARRGRVLGQRRDRRAGPLGLRDAAARRRAGAARAAHRGGRRRRRRCAHRPAARRLPALHAAGPGDRAGGHLPRARPGPASRTGATSTSRRCCCASAPPACCRRATARPSRCACRRPAGGWWRRVRVLRKQP